MPNTSSQFLRLAAEQCRSDAQMSGMGLPLAIARLLDHAAFDLEMCERQNSRDPENDGKTRILPQQFVSIALDIAGAVMAEGVGDA
jgi:hypothetical protein